MNLLDRYIAKTVLSAIALVTLMLAGLQLFILFVNQLGDLGKGDYGIWEAIFYVLLDMPYEVYLFFPMASLLGCLIGLGTLANHSELVVMRASGMSIGQVILAVLKAAILLIILVTALGEIILPRMVTVANDHKTQALSGGQALRTSKGSWLRYQNDFISVETILSNHQLLNVYQFHFDKTHHLKFTRKIAKISLEHGRWIARDVAETRLYADHSEVKTILEMPWEIKLKPNILSVSSREPDEMTLHELNQFLRDQKKHHQTAKNYQLAFWQRIIQPFTTMVMMILSIPFIFGPLRSSTMGSKLLAGATMGFGFYIINRFFGSMSQVYQFSAIIAALGPTLLFFVFGFYLMRRVK